MVRRQLGVELRRLREQANRQSGAVARELGWSDSKLSRIETARNGVSAEDLDRLCEIYAVAAGVRERLSELARQSRQRAWWEAYGHVLQNQYEIYIGYEAEATAIHGYYAMVVPGLLQTDEYARALLEADRPDEEPSLLRQRVAVRMARQAILSGHPPPTLEAVIDEAVIRRQVGGADVMRRQVRRLIAQSQRDSISVRVLPFSAGAHQGLSGSFVVLDLPANIGGPLVYCEGMTGGVVRSKPEDLRSYTDGYRSISEVALSAADSVAFLEGAAR